MVRKRVYLYLLLALLVLGAAAAGYYLWQNRQPVRTPQGTLVDAGSVIEPIIDTEEKEVMQ